MKVSGKSLKVNVVQSLLLVALLVTLLSGCAGKTAGPGGPVFFPPAPDEPHVQYLMGINDSTDIEGKPTGFSLLLTGSEQGGVIKKIGKAYGVLAQNGKLYICSIGGAQIITIDFAKKTFDFLKGNVRGPGSLKKPTNIALDKEGNLYVADPGRGDIAVYAPDGSYLKSLGRGVNPEAAKTTIVSVALYDDLLYALDSRGNQILVLNRLTGELVRTMGSDPDGKNSVALPSNLIMDPEGFLFVTNVGKANVMKFDRDGNFLYQFGKSSDRSGGFARPKGIAIDNDGWIYVVDAAFSNVQIFGKDAKSLLGVFGSPGLPAGSLNLPAGVAVSTDNLDYFQKLAAPDFILKKIVYVVNQSVSVINPTVSVYGIGEMKGSKSGGGSK